MQRIHSSWRLVAAFVLFLAIGAGVTWTQPGSAYLRIEQFLLLFVFLICATVLARGRLRDALLAGVTLALGLCAFEGVALIKERRDVVTFHPELFGPQPVLGWEPATPGVTHAVKTEPDGRVVFDVNYTIDANHMRQTLGAPTGAPIVFVGDSFTFGEGLNDADTLPQAFSDLNGRKLRILNLGVSAYGPSQVLRELQTGIFDSLLQKPRIFVFQTADWHADRTSCKPIWSAAAPRYELEGDKLVYKGVCTSGWRLGVKDFLHGTAFYRVYIEPIVDRSTRQDAETYIRIVNEAARLAKAKYGAQMIILFMRHEGYLRAAGFTDDQVIAGLRAAGDRVLDTSIPDDDGPNGTVIRGDVHPTGRANRMRAKMLEDELLKNSPNVLAPADQKTGQSSSNAPL